MTGAPSGAALGGFDGELKLETSETKYTPCISVKILVREVEEAVDTLDDRSNGRTSGETSRMA